MDAFERLRRGIPADKPEDEVLKRYGLPDTVEGRRAAVYKSAGYSDTAIGQILAGVNPWLIPSEPIEDDIEFETADWELSDPTYLPDAPMLPSVPEVAGVEPAVSQMPAKVRENELRKQLGAMPSDPVEVPLPAEPPIDNQLLRQREIQQGIARRLLPDSSLSELERKIRYGFDKGSTAQSRTDRPQSRPDPDYEGWGGSTGML